MFNKNYTIKRLLHEANMLPVIKAPFNKLILFYLPESIEIEPSMTCGELLTHLEDKRETQFLAMRIEDMIVNNETSRSKTALKWTYVVATLGALVVVLANVYIGVTTKSIPSWTDVFLPLLIPALVMWQQAGVLKSENAKHVSSVIGAALSGDPKEMVTQIVKGKGRRKQPEVVEDSEEYYQEVTVELENTTPYEDIPQSKQEDDDIPPRARI